MSLNLNIHAGRPQPSRRAERPMAHLSGPESDSDSESESESDADSRSSSDSDICTPLPPRTHVAAKAIANREKNALLLKKSNRRHGKKGYEVCIIYWQTSDGKPYTRGIEHYRSTFRFIDAPKFTKDLLKITSERSEIEMFELARNGWIGRDASYPIPLSAEKETVILCRPWHVETSEAMQNEMDALLGFKRNGAHSTPVEPVASPSKKRFSSELDDGDGITGLSKRVEVEKREPSSELPRRRFILPPTAVVFSCDDE
ncbi:hypothetical protein DL93DRAFT_2171409 [Clavulina sp. PMI_390]|nr:hypothetical protein DL93DRAFT_2171409 [Clavulina sp. PMI_390]